MSAPAMQVKETSAMDNDSRLASSTSSQQTLAGDKQNPKSGKVVSFFRRIYHPLGFQKGYNFPLFIIFAGAMLGFTLARLSYLNYGGNQSSSYHSGSAPGEWYWFKGGIYRVGLTIHLATILPAGLLMIWQFVPVIRHKALIFHRINGYVIIILVYISNVSACLIVRRAFGGHIETQAVVGVLAIITTISITLAYYNIKRLQIDQHRAWMLRAMFYLGTIITTRIIMIISATVTSTLSRYETTMYCGQIQTIYGGKAQVVDKFYPQCGLPGATSNTAVVVQGLFPGRPEQIGASFEMSFGMALWMALFLHAAGVEIYLALTPREGNRLRQVSYERQMERGFAHPGSAGLTSDRWGDADEWKPAVKEVAVSA